MNYRSYSHGVVLGLLLLIALTGLSTIATGSVTAQQIDIAASDLDGEGTIENPYVITNVSELQSMEDDLDAHYTLDNDIDASGTAQWNDGSGFDPIGGNPSDDNTAPAFNGSLDGDNHKITELTISRSNENQVGLFGGIQSARITQLSLVNATVDGSKRVGALVGKDGYQSNINNILVSGSISGSDSTGGLIGQTFAGTVQYTEASVTVSGGLSTGGLVGKSLSSKAEQGTIKNATVTGTVTGDDVAGGLIGRNSALIRGAAASVDVEATGGTAGGLVGENFATIQNVKASGNITGEPFQSGGLAGKNIGTIQDADASGNVRGSTSVGGLVGDNRGMIQNVVASGDVDGTDRVGGLVGASSLSENPNTTIEIAAAAGNVTGSGSVGGLVGTTGENTTIENTVAAGDIDGSDSVGGLIGENGGTIRKSFAVGSVNGDSGVGGVIGSRLTTGQVNESYWDEQTTGETSSAGNATGLTTAEMTGQAAETNMTGLEFGTVWETQPNDYPLLISFISDEDSDTGTLIVENLTVPDSISQGENISISATINNTDENSLTQNITLSYSYTAGNVGGGASNSTSITVAGESTEQVSTQLTVPTDADSLTIDIASEDDSLSTTLNVNESGDTTSDLAGSGTQADPYVITNVSELQAMEDDLDSYYKLKDHVNASVNAESGSVSGFTPIGTVNNPFTGTLNGDGYTITGLTIKRQQQSNVGLFAVMNGSVTNTRINDANITGQGDFPNGVGILAGRIGSTGEVTNVVTSGTVTGSEYTGGIAGLAAGNISNSSSSATISMADGRGRFGGLVGGLGNADRSSSAHIKNSHASGDVSGGSGQRIGGLVGNQFENTSIETSYATGSVSGDRWSGGLVGLADGIITDSHSTGQVSWSGELKNTTSTDINNVAIGGLAGGLSSDGKISDSYTRSDVISEGQANGRGITVAGVAGINFGDIERTAATGGTLRVLNNPAWEVPNSGYFGTRIGGITNNNGNVSESYANVTIITRSTDGLSLGGITGNNFGSVKNTYVTGSITVSESPSNRPNSIAGLTTQNTAETTSNTRGEVLKSYAAIDYDIQAESNDNIVGAVDRNEDGQDGNNEAVVDTVYWDQQLSGERTGIRKRGGSVNKVQNLSTSQMIGDNATDSMSELNFQTVWKTQPDGYPVLRSQILDEDDDDDGGGSGGGDSDQLVYEDTVFLSGSTVTVNASGVNAIAVENLPTNTTISEVSANGTYNPDERSIIYANLNEEEVLTNVTFNVNPNDSVYTTSDTITFSVDRTQVSLEVTTVPKELQGDVTSDQYAAVTNETNVLTAGSLSESINGWADNGKTNGVEIGALELSRLINYWSDT
jgi:hypothetical protein